LILDWDKRSLFPWCALAQALAGEKWLEEKKVETVERVFPSTGNKPFRRLPKSPRLRKSDQGEYG